MLACLRLVAWLALRLFGRRCALWSGEGAVVSEFVRSLEKASERVATWPEWKRNILGGRREAGVSEMTIIEFCDLHNACADGRKWAVATGCTTMAELWQREDLRHDWREWIATRPGVLPDRELRLYACWCVRQVWHLLTDERSRAAVEVAERHADGLATDAELEAAGEAAWAAWEAAWTAWAAEEAGAARAAARAAAAAAGAAQSKWLIQNTRPQFEKGGGGE
jgi:hypothetical protein